MEYTPFDNSKGANMQNAHTMLKTLHREGNELEQTFFSLENQNNIQRMIQREVVIRSGGTYKIGDQNEIHLQAVMRYVFLNNARNLSDYIDDQVNELNVLVLNECIPNIISNIQQHLHYLKDASEMYTPIDRPSNVNIKGERNTYSLSRGFSETNNQRPF
jgi:hypothetical protein